MLQQISCPGKVGSCISEMHERLVNHHTRYCQEISIFFMSSPSMPIFSVKLRMANRQCPAAMDANSFFSDDEKSRLEWRLKYCTLSLVKSVPKLSTARKTHSELWQ